MVSKISRRDFLKLLGAGGFGIVFFMLSGGFLRNRAFFGSSAQSSGSWSLAGQTSAAAIHASLMPSGKVFYIAGSSFSMASMNGPFKAFLLDPDNNSSETDVPLSEDLFCCGHTHLSNGSLFVAGGTLQFDTDPNNCNGQWHGLKSTYEYDSTSSSLVKKTSMTAGRWYPTCITLSDGKIFTVSGYDEYGAMNYLVEIYDPESQSWSIKYDPGAGKKYCIGGSDTLCPGAGSPCFGGTGMGVAPPLALYPRMHMMPSGSLVTCGPRQEVRSFDPATGRWKTLANLSTYRHYGTSFLLPLQNTESEGGKILVVGGSPTSADPATTTVEMIEFNGSTETPVIRTVNSIKDARKFLNPVILPDGKCVVFAGSLIGTSRYVYSAESFDPVTESWTTLPSSSVPRSYHGVAILLADGRVWTASSSPNKQYWEPRIEIFSPWYYSESRPSISGNPIVGDYGATIVIPTLDSANVASVSLIRLPSQTHHFDPNMRFVWLQIVSRDAISVTVSAPINNRIAPPGYYMLHILDNNSVPSAAKIIKIPGQATGGTSETFYDVSYPGSTYARLGATSGTVRYGEEAYSSLSQIKGKALKQLVVYLRKVSNPSGEIKATIRQKSDDAIVANFNEVINASSLLTTFTAQTFTLSQPFTLRTGDRILIEYSGPSGVDISVWDVDKFDAGNTRRVRYTTSYSTSSTYDIAGTMSSG